MDTCGGAIILPTTTTYFPDSPAASILVFVSMTLPILGTLDKWNYIMFLCVWIISLNIMFLRFISVALIVFDKSTKCNSMEKDT